MKCRMLIDIDFFKTADLTDCAVSYDNEYNFIHIELDSAKAPEIWNKMDLQHYYDKGYRFFVIDENRNKHKFSAEGIDNEIVQYNCDYNKRYKQLCSYKQKTMDTDTQIQGRVKKFRKSGIYERKVTFTKYKAYTYVDLENKIAFPYRLKKSNSSTNQPLVIYFHGAGALGFDNHKPLCEFLPINEIIKKYNANILIPQAPKYSNTMFVNSVLDKFYISLTKLINELCKSEAIDSQRIYLIGTSFGGCCVWQMLWDNPNMFACGVPVMGLLTPYILNKTVNLEKLKNVPIWIAHSSDDENVPIVGDDFCFEQLKKLNAPVKYTRLEKYGHSMSKYFYKDENWAEWMFSQKKSKEQ